MVRISLKDLRTLREIMESSSELGERDAHLIPPYTKAFAEALARELDACEDLPGDTIVTLNQTATQEYASIIVGLPPRLYLN